MYDLPQMIRTRNIEKAKQDYGVQDYSRSIRGAVHALWAGSIDYFSFVDTMILAIHRGLTRAWHEGAKTFGISPQELTPEERRALSDEINTNISAVLSFADQVSQNTRANKDPLAPLYSRAQMWANRYDATRSIAMMYAGRDKKLRWEIGPCREHCFVGGTKILTNKGRINIEDIKTGDMVYTRFGLRRVYNTEKNMYLGDLYNIDGVICTAGHKFLTQNGWVEAKNLYNLEKRHVRLPNSNDPITAGDKINILSNITSLLGELSFGKRKKSGMTVPIVSIGLNDNITNFGVNDEFILDDGVGFVFNSKSVKITKHRNFQLGWFILLTFLLAFNQIVVSFKFFARMIIIKFLDFIASALSKHGIILDHKTFCGSVNPGVKNIFIENNSETVDFIIDRPLGESKKTRNAINSITGIVFDKIICLFDSPWSIFYKMFLAVFPISFSSMTASWTSGIPIPDSIGFLSEPTNILVSTFNRTESRSRLTRINNLREWLLTQFTNKIFCPIRFFLSRRHFLPPYSVVDKIISYQDNFMVYNLEIENDHEFIAGNMVVHNCSSCTMLSGRIYRASIWKKYDVYPKKHTLACRGYRCCCRFVPTTDPATSGRPPAVL